jgi:hypothetical protein
MEQFRESMPSPGGGFSYFFPGDANLMWIDAVGVIKYITTINIYFIIKEYTFLSMATFDVF